MSKERLEEIKEKYNFGSIDRFVDVKLVNPQELKWLIEQAERVQELEDHKSILQLNLSLVLKKKQRLEQQNKRYKQALEFYADEEHYKEKLISEAQYDADGICISNDEYAPPIIYFDSGEKARQALEGET